MSLSNTTILIRKSVVSGNTPTELANGEIAINSADGRLFYSDPVGAILSISNQNTFGTVNANSTLVIASNPTDTLSLVAGDNIKIEGDGVDKKITISASTTGTYSSHTTSSTSQVTIDSFSISTYRSAKYEAQITSGSKYHVIELRTVHDGTDVWLAQYGEIQTSGSLGNFDCTINSGNLQLLFTPTYSITTLKIYRNSLVI